MATLTFTMTEQPVTAFSFVGWLFDTTTIVPFSGVKPIPFQEGINLAFSFVGWPNNGGTYAPAGSAGFYGGTTTQHYYWT